MNEHVRLHSAPRTTQAAEGLPRREWTVADVMALVQAGFIDEDERFEMIGGEIVPMSPKGSSHELVKRRVTNHFHKVVPERFEIVGETTLHLDERSFFEPDIIVIDRDLHPELVYGPKVRLAVEIADSSLKYDQGRKSELYAKYRVREVWVINALTLVTTVRRRLGKAGYGEEKDIPYTKLITPTLVPELALRIADLGLRPLKRKA